MRTTTTASKSFAKILVIIGSAAFALTGCTVDAESAPSSDVTPAEAEAEATAAALKSWGGGPEAQGELYMIQLQQQMAQRQLAIQISSNLAKSLHDGVSGDGGIIQNIGR